MWVNIHQKRWLCGDAIYCLKVCH